MTAGVVDMAVVSTDIEKAVVGEDVLSRCW
jgi:hypothetical protein